MTAAGDDHARRNALLDAALAAVFLLVGLYELFVEPLAEDVVEGPMWLNVFAVVAGTVPLAWRRRAPFWVSLAVFGSIGVRALFDQPLELYPPAIAGLVATYTVASYAPLRDALLAAAFAGLCLSVAVVNGSGTDATPDPLASAVLYGSVWLIGRVVGLRNERARELHAARDQHALEAVAAERARIAREMHDAVSHSLAAIVMQSSGAQNVLASDPDRAAASLASIETAARRGLAEMRKLLGLLGETEADLAPQPGLDRLEELVASVRDTGLPVELAVVGEKRPVPGSVDVSAYRIVQESLTNVMKHARATTVRVEVRFEQEELAVEVVDDGAGGRTTSGTGGGRGLTGMRERAHLLGGRLEAGETGTGFRVAARLPL